ncbi:hypothetical protein EYS14_07205 [Alteromonadaceae bacterium M269]|nr:hypothetical protein EYS14_07205 [Alteromonadaceae bacterium M269]
METQTATSPRDTIKSYFTKWWGAKVASALFFIITCLQVFSPHEGPEDIVRYYMNLFTGLFSKEISPVINTYPLQSRDYKTFSPVMFDASNSIYDEEEYSLIWKIHFLGEVESVNKISFSYVFENPGAVMVKLLIVEKDKPNEKPIEKENGEFYVNKSVYEEHFTEPNTSAMTTIEVMDNMILDYNSAPILYQLDYEFHTFHRGVAKVSTNGQVIDPWYNFDIYRSKFLVLDSALLVSQMDIMKEQVTKLLVKSPMNRRAYVKEYEEQWQCVLLAGLVALKETNLSVSDLVESVPELCTGLKTRLQILSESGAKQSPNNNSDNQSGSSDREIQNPISNLNKELFTISLDENQKTPINQAYITQYLQVSDIALASFANIEENNQIYFDKRDGKSPPKHLFKKFGSVSGSNRTNSVVTWKKPYLVNKTDRTTWRSYPWVKLRNPIGGEWSQDFLWYPWGNTTFNTFLSCSPTGNAKRSAENKTVKTASYTIDKKTQCHEWFDTGIWLQANKHYCISADIKNVLSIDSKIHDTKSVTVEGLPEDTWTNRYSYLKKPDGSYLNVGYLIGTFKGETNKEGQPLIFAIGRNKLYSTGNRSNQLSVNLNDTNFSDNFGEIIINVRELTFEEDAQQCQ